MNNSQSLDALYMSSHTSELNKNNKILCMCVWDQSRPWPSSGVIEI